MTEQEKMRTRVYNLIVLSSVLFMAVTAPKALAESSPSQEYQVKAAFLYNFLQFVDWPEEKLVDSNEPIIIGIIGNDPFGSAFEPIKDKKVKGRAVVIKHFKGLEELKKSAEKDMPESSQEMEPLTKCHLLFICPSEQKNLKEIIDTVKDQSILTVGEMEGFLENGGIINWFVEEKKIRFEINTAAAERAKLKIRSNLLRLAKRVVEKDIVQENKGPKSSLWAGRIRYASFAKYDNKV
jgi:hypothetical protein